MAHFWQRGTLRIIVGECGAYNVKVYKQRRIVGYADYRIGMFYIAQGMWLSDLKTWQISPFVIDKSINNTNNVFSYSHYSRMRRITCNIHQEVRMLYKYRGIKDFRFFVDIVLKKRLYASSYSDLNDPMEGRYKYKSDALDSDVIDLIERQKEKLRICSLSVIPDNELMWSHYAEGHRGVVIGVNVDNSKYKVIPIEYHSGLKEVGLMDINNYTARDIFSHKLDFWEYEKEVRVFVEGAYYVDVLVEKIIAGRSMSNQDFGFITELVAKIDNDIKIERMT